VTVWRLLCPPASANYSSIDGLLPLHTFRAVSFRQREGYVELLP
jgi:hypothetical protein